MPSRELKFPRRKVLRYVVVAILFLPSYVVLGSSADCSMEHVAEVAPPAQSKIAAITQRMLLEQRTSPEVCYSFIADEFSNHVVAELERCISSSRHLSPAEIDAAYRQLLALLFMSAAINHQFCAESTTFRAEFHSRVAMSAYGDQKDRAAAAEARDSAARWQGAADQAATNVQTLLSDAAEQGDADSLALLGALLLQRGLSVHDPNLAADYAYSAAIKYLAAGKRNKAIGLISVLDDIPEGRPLASKLRAKLYN